jgi:hypothetical protein
MTRAIGVNHIWLMSRLGTLKSNSAFDSLWTPLVMLQLEALLSSSKPNRSAIYQVALDCAYVGQGVQAMSFLVRGAHAPMGGTPA